MALLKMRHTGGYMSTTDRPMISAPVKSMASIFAILFAVGSFWVDNAAAKIMLAVVAVAFGVIGMLRSISPRVSGGILSMVAIVIAVIGFFAAILDAIGLF